MPEAFCGLETVRQKPPWTLCALWEKKSPAWEKKLSSKLHASHLIEWVRSISHRKTLKNRTFWRTFRAHEGGGANWGRAWPNCY